MDDISSQMPPPLLEYVHALGVLLGGPPSWDPTTSHILLAIALSVTEAVVLRLKGQGVRGSSAGKRLTVGTTEASLAERTRFF